MRQRPKFKSVGQLCSEYIHFSLKEWKQLREQKGFWAPNTGWEALQSYSQNCLSVVYTTFIVTIVWSGG